MTLLIGYAHIHTHAYAPTRIRMHTRMRAVLSGYFFTPMLSSPSISTSRAPLSEDNIEKKIVPGDTAIVPPL